MKITFQHWVHLTYPYAIKVVLAKNTLFLILPRDSWLPVPTVKLPCPSLSSCLQLLSQKHTDVLGAAAGPESQKLMTGTCLSHSLSSFPNHVFIARIPQGHRRIKASRQILIQILPYRLPVVVSWIGLLPLSFNFQIYNMELIILTS